MTTQTTVTEQPTVTYSQYKKTGEWRVKVQSDTPPEVGDKVVVTKKNGGTKEETIFAIKWSGKNDNGDTVHLCTIKAAVPF